MYELFEEIKNLHNIKQDFKYHEEGNVLTHTELVCKALVNEAEWEKLTLSEKKILYLAAMFHDIGKSVTTKILDGEIVSPKHSIKGAKIFRELAYIKYNNILDLTFNERESVAWLIRYHGLPIWFIQKEDIDYELIKARESVDFKLLYLLSKADVLGRICEDRNRLLETVEYFKKYTQEIGCYYNKKKFANEYSRFLYLNNNKIWYGEEVFDNRSFVVYIMMGIPLAGKDTYIENNKGELPVISLDNIREEFKISPGKNSKKVASIAKERAKVFLRKGESFVWNATNINKSIRKSLCELFTAYGAKVEYIYIEVPFNTILERNKKRKRYVLEGILKKMIRNMDMIENWEGNKIYKIYES